MLHIKFGFDLPSGFRGKIFEIVDGRVDDGRDHDNHISSLCEPNGSCELIIC